MMSLLGSTRVVPITSGTNLNIASSVTAKYGASAISVPGMWIITLAGTFTSALPSLPAVTLGTGWARGNIVFIVNNGTITGQTGTTGATGTPAGQGANGPPGSPSIPGSPGTQGAQGGAGAPAGAYLWGAGGAGGVGAGFSS